MPVTQDQIAPPPPFKVPAHLRDSPLWDMLVKHQRARLESLRAQNDADKSSEETAKLRGRIAEVKAFLALAEDSPPVA